MSDFKALMERRRRLADSGTAINETTVSEKNDSKTVTTNNHDRSFLLTGNASNLSYNETNNQNGHQQLYPSKESQTTSDFKALMERRRKLADIGTAATESNVSATDSNQHEISTNNDSFVLSTSVSNLSYETISPQHDVAVQRNSNSFTKESLNDFKSLMERRRKLADGKLIEQTMKKNDSFEKKTLVLSLGDNLSGIGANVFSEPTPQQQEKGRDAVSEGPTNTDHYLESPSSGVGKMKDNLATIMERRREIADSGFTINHTSDLANAHVQSPSSNTKSTATVNKGYVVPELYDIMARRKKLADDNHETQGINEDNCITKLDVTRRSSEIVAKFDSRNTVVYGPHSPVKQHFQSSIRSINNNNKVALAPELVQIMARRKKLTDNVDESNNDKGDLDQNTKSSTSSNINLIDDNKYRRSSEILDRSSIQKNMMLTRSNSDRFETVVRTDSGNNEKFADETQSTVAQHNNIGQSEDDVVDESEINRSANSEFSKIDDQQQPLISSKNETTTVLKTNNAIQSKEKIVYEKEIEIHNLIENATSHEQIPLPCEYSLSLDQQTQHQWTLPQNENQELKPLDVTEKEIGAVKHDDTMQKQMEEVTAQELSQKVTVEVPLPESVSQSLSQKVINSLSFTDQHNASVTTNSDEPEIEGQLSLAENETAKLLTNETSTITNGNDSFGGNTSHGKNEPFYETISEGHGIEEMDTSEGPARRKSGGSEEMKNVVLTHSIDEKLDAPFLIYDTKSEPNHQVQVSTLDSHISDALCIEGASAHELSAETIALIEEETHSMIVSPISDALDIDESCMTDSGNEANTEEKKAIHEDMPHEMNCDLAESQAIHVVTKTASFATKTDSTEHETDTRKDQMKKKKRDSSRTRSPDRSRSPKPKVRPRRLSKDAAIDETVVEKSRDELSIGLQISQIEENPMERNDGSKSDSSQIVAEKRDKESSIIKPTTPSRKSSRSTDKQKVPKRNEIHHTNDIPVNTSESSDKKGDTDDSILSEYVTPESTVAKSFDFSKSVRDVRLEKSVSIENDILINSIDAASKNSYQNDGERYHSCSTTKKTVSELHNNLLTKDDDRGNYSQLPITNTINENSKNQGPCRRQRLAKFLRTTAAIKLTNEYSKM
jgi:hypothetical protein